MPLPPRLEGLLEEALVQEGEGREQPIPKGGKLMTRRPQLLFPQQTLEGQPQVSINILGSLEGQVLPESLLAHAHPPGSCLAY